MKKANNFQIAEVQPQGVIKSLLSAFDNFSLVLLIQRKRMQHIRKPRKHRKPWFVNFSSFSFTALF